MNGYIREKLEKLVHIVFSLIFVILAFFTLFHFEKYTLKFEHSILKTIVFAVCAFFIVEGYVTGLEKSRNKENLVRIIFAVVLCIVQLLFFLKVMTPIGWDVMEVVNSAEFGMYNGDYFTRLPQNLLLHLLLRSWWQLFDFIPSMSALRIMEILNLFCVDISLLMLYFLAKKMYGQKIADRIFASSILLIAFHPTLTTIYSDTMAMPYPIGILFFAVYGYDAKKKFVKMLCGAGIGMFCVVGYNIKPTSVIVAIAVLIFMILKYKKNCSLKTCSIIVISATICAIITVGGIYRIEKPIKEQLAIEYPEIKSHSILHYIGLGLSNPLDDGTSGFGTFCSTEVQWTQEHRNNPSYKKEAVEHIIGRIKNYGIVGYPQHLMNKIIWSGSDGTFFYGREGDFHLEEQAPQGTLRGFLQNATYRETDFYQKWFSSWMQGVWFYVCILCALSIFRKQDNTFNGIAKLSVCGLFLFLMIFENRARYLFLFLPVILIAAESNVCLDNVWKRKGKSIVKKQRQL